jgi:hypothetical protein
MSLQLQLEDVLFGIERQQPFAWISLAVINKIANSLLPKKEQQQILAVYTAIMSMDAWRRGGDERIKNLDDPHFISYITGIKEDIIPLYVKWLAENTKIFGE